MSSTFRIVPLIPGLVNEVALEIFLYFVAIDRDGPSTLVLVCTAWRDAVLGSKFLQSLRRKRRRPNPALGENRDKVEEGICIVSFDGGGPGSMSQLRMLEEFMARLAFKERAEADELLPADYFDLMGGVGFGGLVALLLGRLRMTTSQAMEELARIGTATFPEGDDVVSPEVNIVRLRKALESMLERNGHSVEIKPRDSSGNRCKVVLFAAATEVMDHCHPFRTYLSPRKCLECTFVDAACATIATPGYFSFVSIGPRLRRQKFAGIPHNFHNPMREVLKEARLVFGENTLVSLMLSLGAGQPARHSSLDNQVTRRSLIHYDGVARDLQDQLRGFAEYLRLNVDKGMENIELAHWHELGSIETYTNVYLEMNQITRYIDRAIQLLVQRNGSVTLGNLSGTSADCVVKFHSESLEKYLAMEFKQMQDVIQELGIEKVTLVDAIGKHIPIPKHFCPTYAMLLDVIKVYFRHQKPPGSDFVERGDYRLLQGSSRGTIDPVEWDQLENVKLKVEMSMILRTRNNDKARCPRCGSRSEAPPTNGWATCASCSGQFEIEDQLVEYEVESGDDSHDEEVHAEENSIVTPAVESVQTGQGRSPIKVNKKIAKDEELKFRLISVVNLLDTFSLASLEDKVSILEEKTDSQAAENENLRELLTRLQQENLQLKQHQFNLTLQQPLASTSTNTGVGGHQAASSDANMNGVRSASNTPSPSSNGGNRTATNVNRANASTRQLTSNSAPPSELNLLEPVGLGPSPDLNFTQSSAFAGLAPPQSGTSYTITDNGLFGNSPSAGSGGELNDLGFLSPFSDLSSSFIPMPHSPSAGSGGELDDLGFLSPFSDLSSSFTPMPHQTIAPKRGRPKGVPGSANQKHIGKVETVSVIDDDEEMNRPAPKHRKMGASVSIGKEPPLPRHIQTRMREAFQVCHRAVMGLRDEYGRLRCELFKELPDRDDYPDYYLHIVNPIAISSIRKRVGGTYYRSVAAFKADWHLMFANARDYNHEGSIVYEDANQMQKVFDETLEKVTAGLDIPMVNSTGPGSAVNSSGYATPNTGQQGASSLAPSVTISAPNSAYATPPRRLVKRNIVDSDDEDYYSSE